MTWRRFLVQGRMFNFPQVPTPVVWLCLSPSSRDFCILPSSFNLVRWSVVS
jgi:hypothetical protein